MSKYDLFVGRVKEQKKITNWINQKSNLSILIGGDGGIGKTFLLQKFAQNFSNNDKFVVDYFDLAEQPPDIMSQAHHLAASLGPQHFPVFFEKVNRMATGRYDLRSINPIKMREDAIETCVSELKSFLSVSSKKLLRITDTMEIALEHGFLEQALNERIKDLNNVIFITAGRRANDALPRLKSIFGSRNVKYVHLSGFDDIETEQFFAKFDQSNRIPKAMRKKLQLLTEARPVLLSLAVEYLKQNVPLPEITNERFETLKEEVEKNPELKEKFEFDLVSKVRDLRKPKDRAVLYMAQINRRTNSEIISILLGINKDESENLLKEILELAFVKEFVGSDPLKCTLHDEMIVLVNKHAWRYIDNTGEEQKRLIRKVVIQYYEKHIKELAEKQQAGLQESDKSFWLGFHEGEWEKWLLESECLYYRFRLSEKEGIEYFDHVFYDALSNNQLIRMQFLINEMEKAGLAEMADLRRAEYLRRMGQVDDARAIYSSLNVEDLSIDNQISVYSTLGAIEMAENPREAEIHFQKALNLSVAKDDKKNRAIQHNNLGRLYRIESKLEDAIEHFTRAMELAYQSDDLVQGARSRNNLAATYRLVGKLQEADVMCRTAIAELKNYGQKVPLAYAYLAKADIDRDKGSLPSAERFAHMAYNIFADVGEVSGQAQVFRSLASIHRLLQNFDQALMYLNRAIDLIKDKDFQPVLASLYQVYGRTVRHYATYLREYPEESSPHTDEELFKDALTTLQMSIQISEEIQNPWEEARSLLEVVLIKMLSEEALAKDALEEMIASVWKIADRINDDFLRGYVYENRGRIALNQRDYLSAGKAFGEAAKYISHRMGQEADRAFDRLYNILLDPHEEDQDSDAIAQGILNVLSSNDLGENKTLVALMEMCRQILKLPTI